MSIIQRASIGFKAPVTINGTALNFGTIYGNPAPAGTLLSNLTLGAVSANVKFVNAGSWIDLTGATHTWNAGDYAFTPDSLVTLGPVLYTPSSGPTINGFWCSLDTNQITAVAQIIEGLPGLPATQNGIEYQLTAWYHKIANGILQSPRIVSTETFTVYTTKV